MRAKTPAFGHMAGLAALFIASAAQTQGAAPSAPVSQALTIDFEVAGTAHRVEIGSDHATAAVLAPRDGSTSPQGGAQDGASSRTVLAPGPSLTKTSRIVSDPIHGTADPVFMPGAVVEYCDQIATAVGSPAATNTEVTDTLPAGTAFQASFGILVGGTTTNGVCNTDGKPGGSNGVNLVTADIGQIGPGETRTVLYRATVGGN